jgi:Tol biopolymer transport system component/predicted Ser/Thr protein kinase
MPLVPGTRVGPYEVVSAIGAGGMGEVYRARDAKLGRDVALKILPGSFARDAERVARLQREAQVLASLNHQHIAQIYGVEGDALVMELVDGPTLADRIAQGPLPLDEALPIARQIAEALEAAHEQGIIHRDLKPANIKIRPDGTVKVLDFGLAKLSGPAEAGHYVPGADRSVRLQADPAQSPTITSPVLVSGAGMILGTAAYMAPEQARGKAVDKRADIWAFGVVLYEMLTGVGLFAGETITDVLASVVRQDPDLSRVPANVRPLLRRCLEKDPRRRLRDIGDAMPLLETVAEATVQPAPGRAARVAWSAAALLLVTTIAAAGMAIWFSRLAPVDLPEVRLEIATPLGDETAFALSPDGRQMVFAAALEGDSQLWIRQLDREGARSVPGTEGAAYPFWSPDGRSVAFFSGQKLKRVDLAGGGASILADAPAHRGGTWGADGTILFVPGNSSPVMRIPAAGGRPTEALPLKRPGEASHRFPSFLPDGSQFLFFVTGGPEVQGLHVGSLASRDSRRLVESDSAGVFVPPDAVLFRREDSLVAQRFDAGTLALLGEPFPVADGVAFDGTTAGTIGVSASRAGTFAYRPFVRAPQQLVWFDRAGTQVGVVGDPIPGVGQVRLSPDGRTVAVTRRVNGNTDVWLVETTRGALRRLTSDAAFDSGARWSPDGKSVAFFSSRFHGEGVNDLFSKMIDGSEPETAIVESAANKNVLDWSGGGRTILFMNTAATGSRDIWAMSLDDRKPYPVVELPSDEADAALSPDGRWLAYQSNETGTHQIYVRAFPAPGRTVAISTDGGSAPRWRGDGREILYASGNRLMAVSVMPREDGMITAAAPIMLFTRPELGAWDVAKDGQRFLMNVRQGAPSSPPLTVVLNWRRGR